MPLFIQLPLFALILACLVMTMVWWRQLYTRNAGIVDGWWSYLFGMITILYVVSAPGYYVREIIILLMVVMWSSRLGTHLLIRNMSHAQEDVRYKKLREEYGRFEKIKMWRFFIYQGFSNVLLSIPFLIVCLDRSSQLSWLAWSGVAIWLIAIVGESTADEQLKTFKEDLLNRGMVCRTGLWKYSRHPNYFFEWLIWVGFALFALDSPYGWIALMCPVLMYLLLNKVTGIPMLEELAVKSKGEAYINYQQITSAFFPWFNRKG
jgi:steroid 5-alpha reductase family enzyme